jgi:putative phosphoribosyl transferase
MKRAVQSGSVTIPVGKDQLEGELILAPESNAIVVFAHGSGSSRHSPRNRYVAGVLNDAGLGTLLFDLLTPAEEEADKYTRHLRFNIELLAQRLEIATNWLGTFSFSEAPRIGYFGSSTGAGAALIAAARLGKRITAVVSRGGRPDLAGPYLPQVKAATLLIVGGNDTAVIELNEQALAQLSGPKELRLIPGATHLFEEEGALEEVAHLAAEWFQTWLHSQPENVRSK